MSLVAISILLALQPSSVSDLVVPSKDESAEPESQPEA